MSWLGDNLRPLCSRCGMLVVGGAMVAAAASGGVAPALILAVAGLAANRLAARMDKAKESSELEAAFDLRGTSNADIEALMGRAAALALVVEAQKHAADKALAETLRGLARDVEAAWSDLPPGAKPEVIGEEGASAFFAGVPSVVKSAPTLEKKDWAALLAEVCARQGRTPMSRAMPVAAAALRTRFAACVWEVSKRAWKQDDLAWPALVLRLLSEEREEIFNLGVYTETTLKETRTLRDEVAAQRAEFRTFAGAMTTQFAALAQPGSTTSPAAVAQYAAAVGKAVESLSTALGEVLAGQGEIKALLGQPTKDVPDLARGVQGLHDKSDAAAGELADIKQMVAELLKDRPKVAAVVAATSTLSPIPARTAPGVCNVPAPQSHWIHRESITREIHAKLTSGGGTASLSAAVATAAGGYGKTFAARLYAHEHALDYPGGRFEIGVERGDFVNQLGLLLPLLSPGSDLPPAQAAPIVKKLLEDPPACLLILDNVTSTAAWQEIENSKLLPGGACKVLVTTRDAAIQPTHAVKVPRFTTNEAWTLLARARPDVLDTANVTVVGRLLRAADGLAVAIGAAAAHLKTNPTLSWEAYWDEVQSRAPAALADAALPPLFRPANAPTHPGQEERWHAILDAAYDSLPKAERAAIDFAALLPPDMSPRPWLEALVGGEDGPAAVAGLVEVGVFSPTGAEGKLLGLHRVWHARVNQKAAAEKADRTALLLAIATHAAGRDADLVEGDGGKGWGDINNPVVLTDQSLRWELTPLATVCAGLWTSGHPGPAARVGVWLAGVLRLLGRYAESVACLRLTPEDEAAVEAAIGHPRLASCNSNLALIQKEQGDLPGARASMEKAIAIQSKHFAQDHPNLAISYSNLAMIQQDQGDLPGARASMEKAIAIKSKHFAPDHPTFAISYNNMQRILFSMGDYSGARDYMLRAIAIDEQNFQTDHPALGTKYGNLATIEFKAQIGDRGHANFRRALQIFLKHFGEDHPKVKWIRGWMKTAGCGE